MYSPLEQFDVINLMNIHIYSYDISLTNFMISFLFIYLFFVVLIFFRINNKVIPVTYQLLLEGGYLFVSNLVGQQLGSKGSSYLPLILILFSFILLNNLFGLIPFGVALTSQIILILFVSFTLIFSIFTIGLIKWNISFLKIFIPTCPFILLVLLVPIEIFSYFIRLFSLGIRLGANIVAGHTLVFIISNFIVLVGNFKNWLYIMLIIPLFAILFLEFGICLLQAYVFVVLVCIYLGDVTNFNINVH